MILRVLRKYWGCLFLTITIVLLSVVYLTQRNTELHLRYIPSLILVWLVICALFVFLLWSVLAICKWLQKRELYVKSAHISLIIIFGIVLCIAGCIVTKFCLWPEQTTVKYNIHMVARTQKFSKKRIYYYEYVNHFFFGKCIGSEYYGDSFEISKQPLKWEFYDLNGNLIDSSPTYSYDAERYDDSVAQQIPSTNITELGVGIENISIDIVENREDELVFTFSIDDFIKSYNYYYQKDYGTNYLLPSDKWRSWTQEMAIHSKHETKFYYFTENEKIWPLPTITVYAPTNGEYVQEITLNYDWHSHTESMFKLYEQICFYTLKVFFPDLSDEQIKNLCSEVIDVGYENAYPIEEWYSSESVPRVLYYKDGIGIYPHFALGSWQYFCIVPINQEYLDSLISEDVQMIALHNSNQ